MQARLAFFIFCFLFFNTVLLQAQKSCGTVTYQEMLNHKFPGMEPSQRFEDWMKQKILEQRQPTKLNQNFLLQEVITIPVVVHVVHNGEALGSGANLPDSRILEQIQTLNDDFRRLNADTVNTPPEFQSVAADVEIEFALAVRDPEGLPTNGINRVIGTRSTWDMVHNTELKATSYWPAEDYLNIWVTQLESLLGYAQFPVSTLEGLEIASENRLTDGVVIDTDFFGNNPSSNPLSNGRTATHEIGHFLGLRHIWGDGGCGVDDFCEDTPLANGSNFGCPDSNSCGSDDMVENYMDLTDDLCMNLFTMCQKDRIRVVMDNSPRRLSLLSSPGLTPPIMVNNDAGIKEINMPQADNCLPEVIPQAIVRNYGTNQITSVQVELVVNGVPIETQTINQTLDLLETATVNFSNQSIADQSEVIIRVIQTNGSTDNNTENDQKSITVTNSPAANLPIMESFLQLPAGWEVRNPDNSYSWEVVDAVLTEPGNKAIRMNFFNYDNGDGEYDYLITPALDLTTFTDVSLEFKLAYAQFSPSSRDGLIVAVSTDCGNTFNPANYQYQQEGASLATAGLNSDDYQPASQNEWRTVTLNLNAFAGLDEIKIAFIGVNDFGNNLYLDDVNIVGTLRPDLDLALTAIISPDLVSCQTAVVPELTLQNTGIDTIRQMELSYVLSSGENQSVILENLMLASDEKINVTFPQISLSGGASTATAFISSVNGMPMDGNSANDTLSNVFYIDLQKDIIPKIETFESADLSQTDWVQVNPDQQIGWEVGTAGGLSEPGNQGAFLNFFNYSQAEAVDYLISPTLDFSDAASPTLTFDLAYAGGDNFTDGLVILASTDCGENFSDTVYMAFGQELATTQQTSEFFPSGTSDWEKIEIDLVAYAGQSEMRLAFSGVNGFGNNLFLDNIEFFTSSATFSLELDENELIIFPNPARSAFNMTFNLSERQPLMIRVMDPLGRVVRSKQLTNVLNQTFTMELPLGAGVYILQAKGASFQETRRIILAQ